MAITFDTLDYLNQLKAADVPEKQAQVQARALRGVLDAALAEQTEVARQASERAAAQLDTKTERAVLKLEMRLESEAALMRKDLEAMQNRLIIKLSAVMVALFGLAGVLLAFTGKF